MTQKKKKSLKENQRTAADQLLYQSTIGIRNALQESNRSIIVLIVCSMNILQPN